MLSLQALFPGAVIDVRSYRGEKKSFVGKVVMIRDVHSLPIQSETHRDRVMTRSQYLVTLEALQPTPGEHPFKSYYHAFIDGVLVQQ